MVKRIFALVVMLLIAAPLFSGEPTTTRATDDRRGPFKTVKHTYTATTSLDSILILSNDSTPIEISDYVDPLIAPKLLVHFQSAEGTAANVDKILEWQVSAVVDAATAIANALDWTTVESDTFANDVGWVADFDASDYRGFRLRALLRDSDDTGDTAVAEEAYFVYQTP